MAIFEREEKPTKYFFNMEKIYNRKKISELKLASEKPTTKESENLEEIETFYRTFYSSAGKVSNETFDSFVSNIQLPTLSSDERDSLEGKLTLQKCRDTLNTLSNGKSPEDDGFTAGFY